MQPPLEYGFGDRLAFSHGVAQGATVESILLANLPGACKVIPAHSSNDRNGTDWWVETRSGNFLSVDAKVREQDWAAKPEPYGADDLALETWSVVERQKIGWTRNRSKRTDYILWVWTDTGRWCLVPFQMLCKVFEDNWHSWRGQYRTSQQRTPSENGGWHSECVFVPRRVVWAEIYNTFAGRPAA